MPTFHLTAPDGAEYEVDAPDAGQAAGAIGSLYKQPASGSAPRTSFGPTPNSAPAPDAGQGGWAKTLDDYMGLAAKGLSFGLADRIGAAGDAALGKGDYASNLADNRATLQGEEARHPVGAPVTETLAGIAAPLGALGVAAKGASLGAKALYGAGAGFGLGAVQGAASAPDWTDPATTTKDTSLGAAVGGGIGAVLPLIGAGAGKAVGAALAKYRGNADGMSRASTSLTRFSPTRRRPSWERRAPSGTGP